MTYSHTYEMEDAHTHMTYSHTCAGVILGWWIAAEGLYLCWRSFDGSDICSQWESCCLTP